MADSDYVQRAQEALNTDPQLRAIVARAQSDPSFRTAVQGARGKSGYGKLMSDYGNLIQARLDQLGIYDPGAGYGVNARTGTASRDSWFTRNSTWLVPSIIGGVAFGTYALGTQAATGGGAASTLPATTTAPLSGTLPAGGTGLAGVSGGASGGAAAGGSAIGGSAVLPATQTVPAAGTLPAGGTGLAGATSGGGGMGVFKDLFSKDVLPYVIGGAAQVGGAAIAAHGNTEAAKIQAESFDKALAEQKRVYEEQRKDLAPYRGLGTGAVGNLAYLSGITLPPPETATPPATATPPTMQAPKPETSALPGRGNITVGRLAPWANSPKFEGAAMNRTPSAAPSGAGMVRVQNPQTGLVHLIPADQVSAAEAAGGVRL